MEEELYEDEGIDYGKVGFVDNSPVLGLLERKAAGLLPILDEAVVMPGGSDATFYRKLATAHGTSPLLTMLSKGDEGERLAFEVSHYAGIVLYDHVTPYPTPRIPAPGVALRRHRHVRRRRLLRQEWRQGVG